MFKTIPRYILGISSLLLCVGGQCHSKWKLLGFRDVFVSGHMANSTVSTFEGCVSLCMNTINCKSVGITSMYISNMMCYLYDVKVYSGQTSENKTGIVYYWPSVEVAKVSSSYTCIEEEKYCYILYSHKEPWQEAQKVCEDDGGYLFLVNSDKKYEIVKLKALADGVDTYYYVGATDEHKEDVWNWLDGGPVNRSYFIPGRPDNYEQKQHCLSFMTGSEVGLDDRSCSDSHSFFCEIPLS